MPGLNWADVAPARNPTRDELRVIALMRTVEWGQVSAMMQHGRISQVDAMHTMRPTMSDADDAPPAGMMRTPEMARA